MRPSEAVKNVVEETCEITIADQIVARLPDAKLEILWATKEETIKSSGA